MERTAIHHSFLLLMAALMATMLSVACMFDVATAYATPTKVVVRNVQDYGAVPNDGKSDGNAFWNAFSRGMDVDDYVLEIRIPKGTYHLDQQIRMYSNTHVIADPAATIVATHNDKTLIFGGHVDKATKNVSCYDRSCKHGGYSQLENIVIQGGTWLRENSSSSSKLAGESNIFTLQHGHNIKIRNMTCKYANTHYFNLASDSDVVVENVKFLDAGQVTDPKSDFWANKGMNEEKYNGIEAVHFDTCDGVGEAGPRAMPLDNTPCRNVVVRNCIFQNVYAGVGNHHPAKVQSKRTSGVTVENCTFSNVKWYSVFAIDFDNVTVKGNKIQYATGIISLRNVKGAKITDNTYTGIKKTIGKYKYAKTKTMPCIQIAKSTGISIEGNTITKPARTAMRIEDGSSIGVKGNTVSGSAEQGIHVTGTKKCTISGNTVKATAANAIRLAGKANATVTKNKVMNAKERGIFVDAKASATVKSNTVTNTKKGGIIMRNCGKAIVIGNTVSKTNGQGISLQLTPVIKALNNKVSAAKDDAMYLRGGPKKVSKAIVKNNVLSSSGDMDLNLNEKLKGTVLKNKLKHNKLYCHPSAKKMKNDLFKKEKSKSGK